MNDVVARTALSAWQRACRAEASRDDRAVALEGVNAVFAAHEPRVYAACYRYVRNPEVAQELAQDVMLVAWSRLLDFDPSRRFSSWLYGICRHTCLRWREKRRDALTEDGVIQATEPTAAVLSQLLRHEREQVLGRAMAALDPVVQEALHCRYVLQLPRAEVEALLGLDDARVVLQKGMRHLRRELPRLLEELGHGQSFLWSQA